MLRIHTGVIQAEREASWAEQGGIVVTESRERGGVGIPGGCALSFAISNVLWAEGWSYCTIALWMASTTREPHLSIGTVRANGSELGSKPVLKSWNNYSIFNRVIKHNVKSSLNSEMGILIRWAEKASGMYFPSLKTTLVTWCSMW